MNADGEWPACWPVSPPAAEAPPICGSPSLCEPILGLSALGGGGAPLPERYAEVMPARMRDNERFARVVRGECASTVPVPTVRQLRSFLECAHGFSAMRNQVARRAGRLRTRHVLVAGRGTKRGWQGGGGGDDSASDAGEISGYDDSALDDDDEDEEFVPDFDGDNRVREPAHSECVEWSGACRASGKTVVPTFFLRGKRFPARKLVYLWFVDDVPGYRVAGGKRGPGREMGVHATCGTARCVQPEHLALRARGCTRPAAALRRLSKNVTASPAALDPFLWTSLEAAPGPLPARSYPRCKDIPRAAKRRVSPGEASAFIRWMAAVSAHPKTGTPPPPLGPRGGPPWQTAGRE